MRYRLILLLGVIILILIVITGVYIANSVQKNKNELKIGKLLELTVDKNEVVDYKIIENDYTLWDENEREKMVKYMKKNNFKIAQGNYEFNQSTTFEQALHIFRFERI